MVIVQACLQPPPKPDPEPETREIITPGGYDGFYSLRETWVLDPEMGWVKCGETVFCGHCPGICVHTKERPIPADWDR